MAVLYLYTSGKHETQTISQCQQKGETFFMRCISTALHHPDPSTHRPTVACGLRMLSPPHPPAPRRYLRLYKFRVDDTDPTKRALKTAKDGQGPPRHGAQTGWKPRTQWPNPEPPERIFFTPPPSPQPLSFPNRPLLFRGSPRQVRAPWGRDPRRLVRRPRPRRFPKPPNPPSSRPVGRTVVGRGNRLGSR